MSRPSQSQIPRRSTSVDNLSLQSQMNRQSAGRSSSIGRQSSMSGRPSSIMGRPSMAPNKINEMSPQDMIHHISLVDYLKFHVIIPFCRVLKLYMTFNFSSCWKPWTLAQNTLTFR
jgi:hypothetical protein